MEEQEGGQYQWIDQAYARQGHGEWDKGVEDVAIEHLFIGFVLSSGVLVRDHYEASLLVIIFVGVQDTVEVRELPGKDVSCEQESWEVEKAAGLREGADERREGTNDGTDKCVGRAFLLEWKIKAQVGEPDRVGYQIGEGYELMVC